MSVNNSHTNDGMGVLLYQGERVLIYAKRVVLKLKKSSESFMDGKHDGNLYLTSHRMLFHSSEHGALKSLSMPFECLNGVQLEQPVFGANYLAGDLAAQPGGNFEGTLCWQLSFYKGGCIEFGKALRELITMVRSTRPSNAPPPYVPPAGSYASPPPAYYEQPPQAGNVQLPTHIFSERPEQGTIFVFDQPPPYGGIDASGGTQAPPPTAPQPSAPAPQPSAPPAYVDVAAAPSNVYRRPNAAGTDEEKRPL